MMLSPSPKTLLLFLLAISSAARTTAAREVKRLPNSAMLQLHQLQQSPLPSSSSSFSSPSSSFESQPLKWRPFNMYKNINHHNLESAVAAVSSPPPSMMRVWGGDNSEIDDGDDDDDINDIDGGETTMLQLPNFQSGMTPRNPMSQAKFGEVRSFVDGLKSRIKNELTLLLALTGDEMMAASSASASASPSSSSSSSSSNHEQEELQQQMDPERQSRRQLREFLVGENSKLRKFIPLPLMRGQRRV